MRTLLFVAMLAVSGAATAQTTVSSDSNSNSNSSAGAVSGSQNEINVGINSQVPEQQTIRHEGSQTLKTNNSVFLAAAVSMSSDYCGGTASAGASGAGITIGGAKPVMDENCQALRRAEKIATTAVTAFNMGERERASKLLSLAVWQLCVAETEDGDRRAAAQIPSLEQGCMDLGLIQDRSMTAAVDPQPVE